MLQEKKAEFARLHRSDTDEELILYLRDCAEKLGRIDGELLKEDLPSKRLSIREKLGILKFQQQEERRAVRRQQRKQQHHSRDDEKCER